MTLLSADLDNPYGYGRMIRKGARRSNEVRAIVEEKSATPRRKNCARSTPASTPSARPLYENIGRFPLPMRTASIT